LDINAADLKVEGADGAAGATADLAADLKFGLGQYKEGLIDAREDLVEQFPMDLAIPYVFLFYGSQFASNLHFDEKYCTFDFNLEYFGLLKKSQIKLLKTIEGTFGPELNEQGDQAMFQLYVDDNFFNAFASVITTIDKMFSVREIFGSYPQAISVLKMLTTDNLGQIFPDIVEEHGKGKSLDVVMSPSHDLFVDGFPDAKPSGVYMDKNGNFKAQLNVPLQINIQTFNSWEPIRFMYATIVAKGKITTTEMSTGKVFNLQPKAITISQLAVKDGKGEEMELEQMLIQSMVNLQLDTVKKMFKNIPLSLNEVIRRFPKQITCFGFRFSDVDISFAKSQMHTSIYHKVVEDPKKDMCAAFFAELRTHQSDMVKQMKDGDSDVSKTFRTLSEKHSEAMDNLDKGKGKKANPLRSDEL